MPPVTDPSMPGRRRPVSRRATGIAVVACFLGVSVPAAFSAEACTTDCYVDPVDGSDANGGGSPSDAKKTIQAAVTAVDAGGTVHLAAGTCSDRAEIGKALTLDGAGSDSTVLQGDGSADGITIQADSVTVRDLAVKGQRSGIKLPSGPSVDDTTLESVVASGNAVHGVFSESFGLDRFAAHGITASDNGPGAGGRGILLTNGARTDVEITGGTFSGNGLVGIDLSNETVTGAVIADNIVNRNGDAGISVLGASDVRIEDNVLVDNVRFGVDVKSSPGPVMVSGNEVRRETAPTDARDLAGIEVVQRGTLAASDTTVQGNRVSGFHRKASGSTGDGFGIVVEGTDQVVQGNVVTDSDIGVQVQGGNPSPNTQGTVYFDRGNAPSTDAEVTGNTLTGNATGVRVVGGAAASASASGVSITGNALRENGTALDVLSTGATGTVAAHFNEIVDSTAAGIANSSRSAVAAENNFWGCNTGPDTQGCDATSGEVDADPWLVLTARLSDAALTPGQTTDLVGDLLTNSDGEQAPGDYPDGGEVAFDGGDLATVSPAADELMEQTATTSLTAGEETGSSSATAAYYAAVATAPYTVREALSASAGPDVRKAEGSGGGTTPFTFTVSLNRTSDRAETVAYRTVDGSATAGEDYAAQSGTVVIPAGETSRTVTVPVLRDRTNEPAETFTFQLGGEGTTVPLSRDSARGVISNDDAKPRLSVRDASVAEGDARTRSLDFVVRLDRPSSTPVTVRFTTAAGSAKAPSDYANAQGTVTFQPGTTSRVVSVMVNGDRMKEPSETLALSIHSASGATIADPNGSGIIRNDD